MSKLTWDKVGERYFETGTDKGVLYLLKYGKYSSGVAWNGFIGVNENPSGAESTALYADNIKYLNLLSNEEFGATIEAYTYPDEFKDCLGEVEIAVGAFIGQQRRHHFGLCYRTLVGNDEDGTDFGYKIHLVFDCIASPTDKSYSTINDTPDAVTFSWDVSTNQVVIEGYKPTATLVLESQKFKESGLFNVLKALEDILYGTDNTESKFPTVAEIMETYLLQMYIRDSGNDVLLDSSGNRIQSRVFD
ncbi:MAG: hypothetical protein IJ192_10315 [Clostridia bacterium]|nr:hypothetical protein [Clostridia bacterium]